MNSLMHPVRTNICPNASVIGFISCEMFYAL